MLLSLVLFSTALASCPGGPQIPVGGPCPRNSTTPDRFVLCPAGDASMSFAIRNAHGSPVQNSLVILDFIACQAFIPCSECSDTATWDPITRTFHKQVDQNGALTMSLCGGGVCSGLVSLYADGVAFGTGPLAPFDQNGDHLVDTADLAAAQAKIATNDRSADFDGDSDVDTDDIALMESHYGHHCLDATPVERSSWGRMKSLYR